MTATAVDEHAVWLDGWNHAIRAAGKVITMSDLPIEMADRAVDLVHQLLTD